MSHLDLIKDFYLLLNLCEVDFLKTLKQISIVNVLLTSVKEQHGQPKLVACWYPEARVMLEKN